MKKKFVTGLIVLLPLIITFFLISFVLHLLTDPFIAIVSSFLNKFNGSHPWLLSPKFILILSQVLILFFFVVGIFILGVLGRWFLLKTLMKWVNALLLKIPFFKTIYHTLKDLITSVLSLDEKKAFNHPVMVDFPNNSSAIIGFASGSVPPQCQEHVKVELESVFVPTIHPITGFLIFVPKNKVAKINLTSEEAFKYTISCGVIIPDLKKK